MKCYRCGSSELALAPLWPYERQVYSEINIIIRQCQSCGLEQNHCGDDETWDSAQAAQAAPSQQSRGRWYVPELPRAATASIRRGDYWTDKAVNPPVHCEICGVKDCAETH